MNALPGRRVAVLTLPLTSDNLFVLDQALRIAYGPNLYFSPEDSWDGATAVAIRLPPPGSPLDDGAVAAPSGDDPQVERPLTAAPSPNPTTNGSITGRTTSPWSN